jgi:flagellar basal-body rod protein FlgB
MSSLYLFSLASQHNHWLATRESVIAGNIANANTPGYKELDIEPFSAVLDSTAARMTTTSPGHMVPEQASVRAESETGKGRTWDVFHSGNNVSVEQELLKAGEVNRAYSLNKGG